MPAVKSLYTKEIGERIEKQAKSKRVPNFHVIAGEPNIWKVIRDITGTTLRKFATQQAAIDFAKTYAKKTNTQQVVVHDRDGWVTSRLNVAAKK